MPQNNPDERVLVIAPVGHDGTAMAAVLNERGFLSEVCGDAAAACRQINAGAGALLITEEALELPRAADLLECLKAQPAWSELPLIILTSGGQPRLARLLDLAATAAGSVTLLERPLGTATLLRSVEVALRSRRRQYQVRDLIEEQHRKRSELEEAQRTLRRAKEFDEAVMQNMGEGLYTVDTAGLVTYMNPAAEKLFGWTLAELSGRKMHDATHYKHPDGSPFPAKDCAGLQVLQRGDSLTAYEDVFIRKDGSFFDVVYSSSPLREGTNITGLVVVFRDITDRKHAENALRQSEERYRTLVSQVKDYAIFRIDMAGRATSWNEGVKRVLGFDEREFIGVDITVRIFTPEDVMAGVPQRELQLAAAEGSANDDRWLRRKDGKRFFASGITTALRDTSGTVVGFSKVLRDVTEKKHAEEYLERTVAERTADLRATNEQLEAFVYSIAHDLRTPLRSMTGYSQLLVEDYASKLEEPARRMLKGIQGSAEFMDTLLLDLLAYGRTARAEMELTPVSARKAWEIALFQCGTQIEETRAQIEAVEPLPVVLAHEVTLGQILANLLSNAMKFVAPGVRPQVRFKAEDCGSYVRLWVEDNGIGIPPDQHERVFRVFERLHGGRYQGTGIGLSIVRKGAERMGGRVGMESEPGKGSRIWIELAKAVPE